MAVTPCMAAKSQKAAKHSHKVSSKPPASDADTADHSTWQQDPALLQQLGATSLVVDFTLRPPQGYTLTQRDENRETDTVLVSTWTGEARADGSAPELRVQVTKIKPNAVAIQTLDERLTALLAARTQQAPWLVYSPYEHGQVNGESFVRVYSKDGPATPAGHPINHGFIYKTTSNDGRYLVTIIAQDVEPFNETTLPLMEASVLTFRQLPH